jgi:hypothetical protein
MKRSRIVAVGWLLLSAAPLTAQRSVDPRLYVGARVRVETTTRADNISGKLVAQRAESLYVESQSGVMPRPVALSNVRGLWVSQGQMRRRTLRGLMIGALAVGALFAAIAAAEDGCEDRPPPFDCMTSEPDPIPYFGIGAVAGGTLGGIVGYFRRSERWERIR